MSDEGKWCYSTNEENYHGSFDTRKECIEEAKTLISDGCDHFFIAQLKAVKPQVTGRQVIELVQDKAYEECGASAETWLSHVSLQDKRELTRLLTEVFYKWCKEHEHLPNFYGVKDSERIDSKGG